MLQSQEWNRAVGAVNPTADGEALARLLDAGVTRLRGEGASLRGAKGGAKGFLAGAVHPGIMGRGAALLGALEGARMERAIPVLQEQVVAVNRALGVQLSPPAGERLQGHVLWLANVLPPHEQQRMSLYRWSLQKPMGNVGSPGRVLFGTVYLYLLLLAALGEAYVSPEEADEATLRRCAEALLTDANRERCGQLLRDVDNAYGTNW